MYSVFVLCLSPPEERDSSFWFLNRTFLGEPGLVKGGNVNLVFTKFPCGEGGLPFGPRRGIPVQEDAHFPCTENRLFYILTGLAVPFVMWMASTSVVPCRALCAVDGHDVCSAVPFVLWMVTTSVEPCRALCAVDGHDVCSALPCPLCCGWSRRL